MPIARTEGLIDYVLKAVGLVAFALFVGTAAACGDGPNDRPDPTPTPGATADPSAFPTADATGEEVGEPLNEPLEDEVWGNFSLQPELTAEEVAVETPGPRADFTFDQFEDSWHHPDGITTTDLATAEANPLIPIPSIVPGTESFMVAQHIEDAGGPVEAGITYILDEIRPEILDASFATLSIRWTLRAGHPLYLETSLEPVPVDTAAEAGFTPVRESIRKVEVRGNPGLLLTYGGAPQGEMYNIAQPTVRIFWFVGPALYELESYFLTPADALAVAGSVRPTTP